LTVIPKHYTPLLIALRKRIDKTSGWAFVVMARLSTPKRLPLLLLMKKAVYVIKAQKSVPYLMDKPGLTDF